MIVRRGVWVLAAALSASVASASFIEDFNSPTIDPDWDVFQFAGSRVYGYTSPANHYSLTDNPGHLRYYLDPMTHWDGFANGYQTTYALHSCCNHDPGLDLKRSFSGDNWVLEAKVDYYLPYTNGRGFAFDVYFGDGGIGTYSVQFQRGRDVNWNGQRTIIAQKTDADPWDYPLIVDDSFGFDVYGPDAGTMTYRLSRTGGVLTASWSADGATWRTAFSQDMGHQLDGLTQRVVVSGLSWFNTAGSYADWDYVRLDDVPEPGSLALLGLGGLLLGLLRRFR